MNSCRRRRFSLAQMLSVCMMLAAAFCWVRALVLSEIMMKSAHSVSMRYESDGVCASAVERMLEEETPFAVWSQKNSQYIKEPDFERETKIRLLEAAGDTALVLPAENLLLGFLPVTGNIATCAIDTATAHTLWDSVEVTGKTVIVDKKKYTIVGVFSKPENTLLIASSLEKNKIFPFVELSAPTHSGSRQQAEKWVDRYALPQPDIFRNHWEEAAILQQLALLPALIAALVLFRRLLQLFWGKPKTALGRVVQITAMVIGGVFIAWAIGFSPVIPQSAIPGRWSDFAFWSRFGESLAEQMRVRKGVLHLVPDLVRRQNQRLLLLYSGGAVIGFAIGIGGYRKDT